MVSGNGLSPRCACGAELNAANAMRSDPATATRRWAAREAARAVLIWRAWAHEGRALALACARRAYARGYARHSPMKGVCPPDRRKEGWGTWQLDTLTLSAQEAEGPGLRAFRPKHLASRLPPLRNQSKQSKLDVSN
eukprot:scaffold74941_cov71-Phaeocystis_antarctica.AAC.1